MSTKRRGVLRQSVLRQSRSTSSTSSSAAIRQRQHAQPQHQPPQVQVQPQPEPPQVQPQPQHPQVQVQPQLEPPQVQPQPQPPQVQPQPQANHQPPPQPPARHWTVDVIDDAGLLAGYLGSIAANDEIFPIIFSKWPKVPSDKKEMVYAELQKKFVVDDGVHQKYIFTSLGKKWRDYQSYLFRTYYNWEFSPEQNIENHPEEVGANHWAVFLDYRLNPKTMKIADKNSENCQMVKIPHTLGSKSLARKRNELELQDGRAYTRGDMYLISHKKRDASFVNDEARKKHEEL